MSGLKCESSFLVIMPPYEMFDLDETNSAVYTDEKKKVLIALHLAAD